MANRKFAFYWCRISLPVTILVWVYGSTLIEKTNSELMKFVYAVTLILFFLSGVILTKYAYKKNPRTVLLLRPFGEDEISIALRKLVLKQISYFGITFTLSDIYLQTSKPWWYNSTSFLFTLGGPLLAWMAIRFPSVQSRSELSVLPTVVTSPFRLAWLHIFSKSRLLVVPASNYFWKDAIKVFLENVDVVVVDLSTIGEGTVWELQQLKRTSNVKVIFVATQTNSIAAKEIIGKFFPNRINLFFNYSLDGTIERQKELEKLFDQWFRS